MESDLINNEYTICERCGNIVYLDVQKQSSGYVCYNCGQWCLTINSSQDINFRNNKSSKNRKTDENTT